MQITIPDLGKDEHYVGIIVVKGTPAHHLILLPGDTKAGWEKAKDWAKKQGGELPTRREQALCFANAQEEFKAAWYWSGEQHAADSDYAWCQDFYDGLQYRSSFSDELRARAVRRVAI